MTTLLAMESQPLENDCVDFDDGLSPRLPSRVKSLSSHTPQKLEPPFLSASNEEVYEDSPRPVEVSSATAKIVTSIYGEFDVEMKASDITLALEAMALKEGSEVIAFYGAKLATFEELLDPENVDPIVTRDECFVALQRWHKSCDCHVMRVDGKDVLLPPDPPKPDDDEDDAVYNCTLSPCCRRVPNEEVDELRYQNKMLQRTIEGLQFQLTTNEKKLIYLKDEKLKLTQEARELRTTLDMYYGYRGENEILERDNSRLTDVVLALKKDLTKAKKERDDFKRKTDDLDGTTNELSLKLEQCVQNEAVFNNLTSRKLTQFSILQTRLDATLEELLEKEREIVELKLVIQQHEERFAELTRAKERRRSEESDCIENICQSAIFDTPHVYVDDPHEVPTVASSVLGGMSLFAELQSANDAANVLRHYRDASTSYELVSVNRATQTPEMEDPKTETYEHEMEDPETETYELDDDIGMYQLSENSTPRLPVMDDRATQTVDITDNMYLVNQNSIPDMEDRETQTIENMETYLVNGHSTPCMEDHETQTEKSVECVNTYLTNHKSTPDMKDHETQTVESIHIMETYLETQHLTPCTQDSDTQTEKCIENVDPYLTTKNAIPDMEDRETQTDAGVEDVDTRVFTQNSTPDMEDRETQTGVSVEDLDRYLLTQNSTLGMEDHETETDESVEDVDTYLTTENSTPCIIEDRVTQTAEGVDTAGIYPARSATSELQEMEDRDTRTVSTFRSTYVINVTRQASVPDMRVMSKSFTDYRGIVPVKRDRTSDSSDATDGERRGVYALSSDELDAESDGGRRYSFADCQNYGINFEEKSLIKLAVPTTTNTEVDGSGDASYSPYGVVSSLEDADRDTRYATASPLPSPRRCHHQPGVRKRAGTRRLRRNDAHVALDREMALLGMEVEGVSRSAQRQFAVVGRALERALEESENNGRAMHELRLANIAERKTRSAATMTVMFPLRRSVSESPVGCSSVRRPLRRGVLMPVCVRNRPPPSISEPARRVSCVPTNAAETVVVTRRQCSHTRYSVWRFGSCVVFVVLAVLMVYSYHCYDCRFSRAGPTPLQLMFEQLERYGIVKRNNGPRPM